jgi:membrane protein DedA with SNARE-associated domain
MLFARILPVVRHLISLPAGAARTIQVLKDKLIWFAGAAFVLLATT